jgi:hypothetical protein
MTVVQDKATNVLFNICFLNVRALHDTFTLILSQVDINYFHEPV